MENRTLLIIPPLDEATHPYPAVPQLASWLRERGSAVDALDLNIKFYMWLLERERFLESCEIAWNFMENLHEEEPLSVSDWGEYYTLFVCFKFMEFLSQKYVNPSDPDFSLSSINEKFPYAMRHLFSKCLVALSFAREFPHNPVHFDANLMVAFWDTRSTSSEKLLERLSSDQCGLFEDFYQELLSKTELQKYRVAGISIPFSVSAEPALLLAKAIKKLSPDTHVVLGGAFAAMNLSKFHDMSFFRYFDSIVVGDGEIPLLDLSRQIESGSPDLSRVPGLVWRDGGEIRRNPAGRGVPLGDLPLIDSVFAPEDYPFSCIDEWVRIRLSRGCSWGRCAFCNLVGCGLYPLERGDEDKIFETVKKYVARGKRHFFFGDDEATADMLERFAKRVIASGLKFTWTVNLRFSAKIDLKWANLLRESGCRMLIVGLESYNDRILKLMKKGTNVALIEKCINDITWSGIRLMVYMIVGLPTETEAEARESFGEIMDHVKNHRLDSVHYSVYGISEGSPAYKDPASFGITSVIPDNNNDLSAGIIDFEHAGMDLQTRLALYREFTNVLSGGMSIQEAPAVPEANQEGHENLSVSWNGRQLTARASVSSASAA
ncbi:MAG: B12-binding domain-containing radical SAM protein [Synergistaceae bacterium]|jgi:hypothetical protein|nr:B12-binding domain-containing radical SAM protein [Synergistaceae bacterium]